MKKFLQRLAVAFCCGLIFSVGFVSAQNITTSIQGSQDPRGPIGQDSAGNYYFKGAGHFLTYGSTGATPTLSSCGTSPTITGTDTFFKLTTGSAATTCTITFAAAYLTAPQCILQENGGTVNPTFTTSTTALTVTVDVASTTYSGFCSSVS
jgi:hypothetical protein